MSSHQDDTTLPEEDPDEEEDDDHTDDEEDLNFVEDDDEEDLNSTSPPSASAAAAIVAVSTSTSDQPPPTTPLVPLDYSKRYEENKKPAVDDNRRLFQRLWTDEDEIGLLQGFLDYTTQRGTGSSHHDTNLFYDQIKSKLQLDFNKNQLVEKLRRLKKKYRNVLNKMSSGKEFSFKSPHDHVTFEISQKIWSDAVVGPNAGVQDNIDEVDTKSNLNLNNSDAKTEEKTPNSRKRSRSQLQPRVEEKRALNDGVALNSDVNVSGGEIKSSNNTKLAEVIEETVKSCLSPLFKELMSSVNGVSVGVRGINGVAMSNPLHLGLDCGSFPLNVVGMSGDVGMDERWRKQQILELEVYSKRLQLVQDQIKSALEDLQSTGG